MKPWKGKERKLVDFVCCTIEARDDAAMLDLDMNWKFEFEIVDDKYGMKKTIRESTCFKTSLPRKTILVELGADHHHEDELCERDLPVVIIRSMNNFSHWLYLKREDAVKLYDDLTNWIEYGR